MKRIADYVDMYRIVQKAGYHTDAQLGKTEHLLKDFFTKAAFPALQPYIFYLLDITQKKYLAIGPGIRTFLGYNTDYLRDGGPFGYFANWHKNDWYTYNKNIFADFSDVLNKVDIPARKNLLIKSGYRVKTKDGNYVSLAQQSSYIDISPDGLPLAAIGIVTDVTPYKQDTRMVYNVSEFNNTERQPNLLFNKYYFPDAEHGVLSKRETEILKWICDGLTTKEIAEKLKISAYTVNNHRTNILQKTNSANFIQVLRYAIQNGIV